jgi:asparagine synthase (glutamine-hydrolysing)
MCGICGFAGFSEPSLLHQMTNLLRHRGPDDFGYHLGSNVGFGCRRLSIIDLAGGHQPIYNEDGKVCVVQNGEIYNYKELRESLKRSGHQFRTESDTEVIVHAYEEFGDGFCRLLNGDFAIAIWDDSKATLLLVRDRLGVHPLYYCHLGSGLIFASELKSLLCYEEVPRDLDFVAVDQYLTFRYVPAGKTLFAYIHKLCPGCYLKFTLGQVQIKPYWTLNNESTQSPKTDVEAVSEQLYELLQDSVRLRMRSDVPVGAYLSGGLDSSAIVRLMSQFTSKPIQTFCIGFGQDIDELDKGRALSQQIGTEHHEIMIDPKDFELLPKIVWHLDEPIGDAIIIPTYRLAQASSQHVKVVMSGEGADEVWGGYIHHLVLNFGTYLKRYFSSSALGILKTMTTYLPVRFANWFFPYPAPLGKRGKQALANYFQNLSIGTLGQEYLALASVYRAEDKASLYTKSFHELVRGQDGLTALFTETSVGNGGRLDRVMAFDLKNWLPDYTLLKQDKLGLANSLEVRVPYLDHRVVEFAAQLPAHFKIRGLTTKYLLRRAVARLLPSQTVWARKKAFYMPVEKVFGTAFDNYVRDVLESSSCRQRGIISPKYLAQRLNAVRTGELLDNKQLVALFILELWFQTFIDRNAQTPVEI